MSALPNAARLFTQTRRFAVAKRARIEFVAQGHECMIDEHGTARIPALRASPGFLLSEEFESAPEYYVALPGSRQRVTREQLAEMVGPAGPAATHHDEDE